MKKNITITSRNHFAQPFVATSMFCLMICSLSAGEGAVMTLPQAIIRALSFDPTIGQAFADVIQADGFAKSTRSDLRPQLALEGSAGGAYRERLLSGVNVGNNLLFSRTTSLVGRQLIWSNGYFSNRYKDAKERTQAKMMLDRDQREVTALATAQTFLDVVRARSQLVFAESNVDEHQRILELARSRAKSGGSQADVELATARTKKAEALLRERRLDLLMVESHFQRYVGIKPPALATPDVPKLKSLSDVNLRNNWHYKAVEHQHAAAQLQVKTMYSKYGPRVYLEARGDVGNNVDGIQGRNNGTSIMITASWNLFDGGQRKADIQQADADVERQRAILDETYVILKHDSQARWDDYRTRAEHIEFLKTYHEYLMKTIELYRQQFELGTRSLLSILDIYNEAMGARISITDDQHQWSEAGYRLLYFGGQLIPRTAGEAYISTPKSPDGKDMEMTTFSK